MKFLAAICLVLHIVTAKVTAGAVSNEDLQNYFKQLEETVKADQIEKRRLESTISKLQHELESVKNKSETNENLIKEEQENMNTTRTIVTHLNKISRIGTSCSNIASLGNLESGTFSLDTDGTGNQAPYEVQLLIHYLHM
jgi:cell division septum initiation protein DivIVA